MMLLRLAVPSFVLFIPFVVNAIANAHTATAERYMIATVHPMATDAGLEVFRDGGDAGGLGGPPALALGGVGGGESGVGGGWEEGGVGGEGGYRGGRRVFKKK